MMQVSHFQRAWLRGALVAGGAFVPPLSVGGQTMDPVMSSLVRFANKSRGEGPINLPAMRKRYAMAPAITGLRPERSVRVTTLDAGGRPARRYQPTGETVANLLYFHGGGFIMGSLDTHDRICQRLAARAKLCVTSVDYRLAPEHPFPAAYDDAVNAWAWARETSPGPWVIGGDSAGANLAAALARDGSARMQVLLYPAVDMVYQDGLYPSLMQFFEGFLLTAEGMRECLRLLIPDGQDPADPRLSPIRADLSRASPALIVAAGFDPLRDQGRAYAMALDKAGARSHLLEERSLPHGFADFAGVVPAARRAVDRIADAIMSEFGRSDLVKKGRASQR